MRSGRDRLRARGGRVLPETVSRTALGTTAARAIESCRPEGNRLFEDRFAMEFLPAAYRAIVRISRVPLIGPTLLALRERRIPGVMGSVLCRTRFIDDTLRDAMASGVQQVAILGAGFDSRAYRIPGANRIPVFEVDHPATQAWKRDRIKRVRVEVPSHVIFVPLDFQRQEPEGAMTEAGFRAGRRSLFIWEGVTQYLDAESVDSVFRYISRAAAPRGRIVFTYVNRGLIDGSVRMEGDRKLLSEVERQGEPWLFGIHPAELAGYLEARGFKLTEDVGAADYRSRYLRPVGRRMRLFKGERVAVAEVAGRRPGLRGRQSGGEVT
jgi:methyltransferase (TIGR00027 family)